MTKTDLETSISNAIRSLYQLIMVVNDETLNCQLIDQNVELKNISAAGSFDSFCEDLFANIHPGDREGFRAFSDPDYFPKELKVKVYVSYECRIRHTDHHYNWSKITFCNAAKEDCAEGHDFLFLIEDIHEWKTRELKEEAEQRAFLKELQDKYDALFEENMRDGLTGCYNRKGLHYYADKVLDDARSTGKHLYVCVVDLNGLKNLNDKYGHENGDTAIVTVSAALNSAAPEEVRAVRTGGDEFLLIAALPQNSKEPDEIEDKIEKYLEEYNKSHHNPFAVGASYGSVFLPLKEGMTDLDEYIGMADSKMYKMKKQRDPNCRE